MGVRFGWCSTYLPGVHVNGDLRPWWQYFTVLSRLQLFSHHCANLMGPVSACPQDFDLQSGHIRLQESLPDFACEVLACGPSLVWSSRWRSHCPAAQPGKPAVFQTVLQVFQGVLRGILRALLKTEGTPQVLISSYVFICICPKYLPYSGTFLLAIIFFVGRKDFYIAKYTYWNWHFFSVVFINSGTLYG